MLPPRRYGPFGTLKRRSADPSDGFENSLPYRIDGILGEARTACPWVEQLPLKLLYVDLPGNAGPVAEAAFLHKRSRTLIVTDAVVYIPPQPSPAASILFDSVFGSEAIASVDFWPKSVLQAREHPNRPHRTPPDPRRIPAGSHRIPDRRPTSAQSS